MNVDIAGMRRKLRIPFNRKIYVVRREKVELNGRYWDGGSKDEYTILNGATGEAVRVPDRPYMGPDPNESYELKQNECILNTGTFCGKPARPRLYIRPEDTVTLDKYSEERKY